MSTDGKAQGVALAARGRRRPPGVIRRALAMVGDAVLHPLASLWTLIGVAAAVVVQGLKPGSWRRTVRAEFVRHCSEMGLSALPAVIMVGALMGLGLVQQGLYWLGLFGQSDVVTKLLVLILVRELAPLSVGLLMLGRSASVILSELHEVVASGRLRGLDAMGIDPVHYLLLPRVLAMALSCFCLNVVFVGTALVLGHQGASLAGVGKLPLFAFLADVFENMGVSEFAISVAKPVLFGFFIALITCTLALSSSTRARNTRELLPRGFVVAMTAILAISVTLSAVL